MKNIIFTARTGQKIAIVGATGAGKKPLMKGRTGHCQPAGGTYAALYNSQFG